MSQLQEHAVSDTLPATKQTGTLTTVVLMASIICVLIFLLLQSKWHPNSAPTTRIIIIRAATTRAQKPESSPVDSLPAAAFKPGLNCTICLSEMSEGNGAQLRCSHAFHRACLHLWAQSSYTCPLCRTSFGPAPTAGQDSHAVVMQPAEEGMEDGNLMEMLNHI